jgi:hypothetical protein
MRLTTWVLFVALFALVGLLTVHEEVERLRAGYRAARLVMERERLRVRLAEHEAELARLTAPARLSRLNDELNLGLSPLPPLPPAVLAARRGAETAPGRGDD